MSSAMMADIQKADEFKVVEKRWHDKFEKEAVKIVDAQYDKKAIKGNKALEEVYENCIKLEIRKAIVYAIMGFTPSMEKQARQNVDEYTNKLGMAYSTLGWLHNHPDERPEKPAKKAKKESKAGPSSASPKINIRRRLRDGIEALEKKDQSFLETLLDSDGSFKTALEDFKKKNAQPATVDNPDQARKITELEGELKKRDQLLTVKNARIQELTANGCALIMLMLSSGIAVLKRYKQIFDYVDSSPVRPVASQAASSSAHDGGSDDAVYPHPLNPDLMVPRSKLRWPLHYHVGGSMYGHTPSADQLLPDNLAMSATSDVRQLALLL